MEIVFEVWFWIVAALWGGFALIGSFGLSRLPTLPRLPAAVYDAAPRVSVVVTARDEERRVGTTLARLRVQRAVDLAIVAVDDRSTDGTGRILEDFGAADPARVTVLRIEQLPAGWLGKCHACHAGARLASGEWILFTDADTWMADDVIARTVHAATQAGADHVCLMPQLADTTLWGRAILLLMCTGLTGDVGRVNLDSKTAYAGLGAFNFVSREAYDAIGGYERLRMEVIDDIGLACLLRQAGFRTRVFFAARDLESHWITSVPGFIALTEKNYFALFGFNAVRALTTLVGGTLAWSAAVVGPFVGTPGGIAAGIGLAALVIPTAALAVRYRWSPLTALLSPLMMPVVFFGIAHSVFKTLRQNGVRWRDTLYPLDELRRGLVRKRIAKPPAADDGPTSASSVPGPPC